MYYVIPKEFKTSFLESDNPSHYIYYDEDLDIFVDKNGNEISIKGKSLLPFSDIYNLGMLIDAVKEKEGKLINDFDDLNNIKHWFHFIEPDRQTIMVRGKDFKDLSFLTVLLETYGVYGSVFIKTVDKDFHGIIPITEVVDLESDFQKAIELHLNDEFLVERVITIDEDEFGKQEYRVFIHNKKITSISRMLHHTYHRIPEDVISFAEQVLENLPSNFPTYFVLDIVRTHKKLDILECNPIETSNPYLYNSRRIMDNIDLTHQNMLILPDEHKYRKCTFFPSEKLSSPIFTNVPESFAKDYNDIKKYGKVMPFIGLDSSFSLSMLFQQEEPNKTYQKKYE